MKAVWTDEWEALRADMLTRCKQLEDKYNGSVLIKKGVKDEEISMLFVVTSPALLSQLRDKAQ